MALFEDENKRAFLLNPKQVKSLFGFVENRLQVHGCNDTLRFTRQWLNAHVDESRHAKILSELESMGGQCDCEVVCNCYEDYDIG